MNSRYRYAAEQAYRLFLTHGRDKSRVANLDCKVNVGSNTVTVTDVLGASEVLPVRKAWGMF